MSASENNYDDNSNTHNHCYGEVADALSSRFAVANPNKFSASVMLVS